MSRKVMYSYVLRHNLLCLDKPDWLSLNKMEALSGGQVEEKFQSSGKQNSECACPEDYLHLGQRHQDKTRRSERALF